MLILSNANAKKFILCNANAKSNWHCSFASGPKVNYFCFKIIGPIFDFSSDRFFNRNIELTNHCLNLCMIMVLKLGLDIPLDKLTIAWRGTLKRCKTHERERKSTKECKEPSFWVLQLSWPTHGEKYMGSLCFIGKSLNKIANFS